MDDLVWITSFDLEEETRYYTLASQRHSKTSSSVSFFGLLLKNSNLAQILVRRSLLLLLF